MNERNERFEELLPWYANGSIGAEDRAWVDAYLQQHPEARSELQWYQSLQARVQENAPAVPPTVGLARTMRLIQGDRPTIAERIGAFFGNFGMRPSYAMAAMAIFAVQGAVIVSMLGDARDSADEIRALHAVRVDEGPMLKVSFAPDAKETDIRMLLVQVNGELAGGPGQLGDYYLRVPAGSEAAALAKVQAAPIVQAAALAPGVPPGSNHMVNLPTRRLLLRGALGAAALPFLGRAMAAPPGGNDPASRIALVIGNGAYKSAPLKNPPGDAGAVASALRGLGYDVTLRQNTRLPELIESLREFSIRAPKASVRMLFYAGHGVQVKGRNYLVPVDADPKSEDDIQRQSADVGEFVDRLSAIRTGANIVVLDACRVNPFAGGVIVGPDGRRLKFRGATPGGLATLDAPVGTLVAFSTAPNGVALDGANSQHSVYARHLLANMSTPGLQIEQLFKRVRIAVAEDTGRVQVPWESSSLTADFCFKTDDKGRCGS